MPPKSKDSRPLFIVGASRSGTALLRSVLNKHPDIYITGETHYFDDLRGRFDSPEKPLSDAGQIDECEDYFRALTHRPYGHGGDASQGLLQRGELTAKSQQPVTPDSLFVAYCKTGLDRESAKIWGEKTPRHIFRMREIHARFPDARIIVMVRDPRAVVASYRDWKNQGGFDLEVDPGHANALRTEEARARNSYNIIIATLLWKSGVAAALSAQKEIGTDSIRILSYENLVGDSERVLRSLSEWLGVAFTERTLDAPVLNSSFHSYDAHGGFQMDAVNHWRTRLTNAEILVIERCLGPTLVGAGYERVGKGSAWGRFAWELIQLPFAVWRALRANSDRTGNIFAYVARRVRGLIRLG